MIISIVVAFGQQYNESPLLFMISNQTKNGIKYECEVKFDIKMKSIVEFSRRLILLNV